MDRAELVYLIPYLVSLAISIGVGIYAWRHRMEAGAFPYTLVAFSQASWTLGYILELLSPDLQGKIFWDNFQFIGAFAWQVAFVAFTLQYTGWFVSRLRMICGFVAIPGIIIVLLAFTDSWHGLIRPNAWLLPDVPFSALLYPFTPPVWAVSIYAYGIFLICSIFLIAKYLRAHQLYQAQVGLVLVGNLVPVVGTILTLTSLAQSLQRDVSPFAFAIGNLIVAWGLFRYRLFDIVPIARHAIIENMTDAVYVIDAQDRLVDINPAACWAIGRSATEVIGRPVDQVFAAWADLLNKFRDVVELDHIEIEVDIPEGHRYVELRFQPLRDRYDRLIGRLVMAHDITARKLAEKELKQRTLELEAANERLQVLSRVKDEFVSNVSHELYTPLANLRLYLDLLTARPEKYEVYMATLRRETGRLESMIESLLALSRFDQDRVALRTTSVDLNALAQEYITDRLSLAESKGLSLTFHTEKDLPILRADRNLVGQVLSILLTNAVNYTPTGGRVMVSTQKDQSNGRHWIGFRVADTGPGISPEEQSRLFSRFFRGKVGRESNISGTGLGLALAKEIVDRYNGRIEVNSEGVPGKGTAFDVWLSTA